MRFPVRDGTEKGRALNGIVCPWDIPQKRACHPRVFLAMNLRSVSLIGDLDFDCVSTAVWHDSCRRNRLEPSGG